MKTRRLFVIRLLCVLFLMSAVVIGLLQRGAIAKANLERQALVRDGEEVGRLMRENAEVEPLRAANHELAEFRPRQRELARLRNEVGQLRASAAEAAKLRWENQQLASGQNAGPRHDPDAMPAGFISRAAMSDAGLGTPEAAVQTLLYAMFQGNLARLLQCQSSDGPLTPLPPEQAEDQSESMRKQFADFPGYFIAETKIISPDEEQIGVQASPGGVIFPIHLVRNGNEWNVKQP
jgi:hypothetical protein